MLKHITDALYRQSLSFGQESKAELEAQLDTNRTLFIQANSINAAVKHELETALSGLTKESQSQHGGLRMVGEIDFPQISRQWKAVDETHSRYVEAVDIVTAMRDRIDEIVNTLADVKLWEAAQGSDLAATFAQSRIKELLR